MTNEELIAVTVKVGAKCAKCLNALSVGFRPPENTIEIVCKLCGDKIVAVADASAYMSIEAISYPDLESDIKNFPRAAPSASRNIESGLRIERIIESARDRAVKGARRAVKSELATDYMRTYKYTDGEKEAASERLRLLAIDMQRADQSDIDNLALHIDSIREGVARERPAPRPLTDALDSIDAADDADFGLMLLDMVGKARTELGRDDITKSQVANIIGRRGYQISVGEGGVEWVVKRDD